MCGPLRHTIAMKSFVIFFSLFTFIGCRSIEGNYSESFGNGWGGANYHFHSDGTFEYDSHYDVAGERGAGNYRIRAGHLVMTFTKPNELSYVSADYVLFNRDSSDATHNFTVVVLDENRDPLIGAVIIFTGRHDSINAGIVTDLDGTAKGKFELPTDSVRLKVRFPGYSPVEKEIELTKFDSIKIQMRPDLNIGITPIDSGTVWKYKYKRKNNRTIMLTERRVFEQQTDSYKTVEVHKKITRILRKSE